MWWYVHLGRWCLTFKTCGWCWWIYMDEANLGSWALGPFVLEHGHGKEGGQ
jgi:hypothetical protein